MDYGRILSTEFKDRWRQILDCGGHDDLGGCRATREEKVIPSLLEKCGGYWRSTENHGKRIAVQIVRENARDQFSGDGSHFRGLDHGSVSRTDGSNEWRQCQHHWIVPRSNDQTHSERIKPHMGVRRCKHKWRGHSQGFHPLPHMRQGMVRLAGNVLNVRPIRVDLVAAKIRP